MEDELKALINERFDKLEKEINELKVICSRMNGHITFVEETYEKFKKPLNIVKGAVEGSFNGLKSIAYSGKKED